MGRVINPFRALTLGYKYHALHEKLRATEAMVAEVTMDRTKCIRLADRLRRDCGSLQRQKNGLELRIKELEDRLEFWSEGRE